MIPILYEKDEKDFLSGGIGFLADCTSCEVTEERNGVFECEFEYPMNGPLFGEIKEGRIIYATHDDTGIPQPFDIYGRSAPIDGIVTYYAHHISYRLSTATVMPFEAKSCAEALSKLGQNIVAEDEFTFWTDKDVEAPYKISVPEIVREVLGGSEGSILDIYGKGEYKFDKFNVNLHLNRGKDAGVEIRFGKNMVDLKQDIDASETYNAIVPYWYSEEEDNAGFVTLPEKYVIHGTDTVRAVPMDLTEFFEKKPTVTELRDKAQSVLDSSGSWEPEENISVDFVQLWLTDEYKDVAPLERVNLCDIVTVWHPGLGIDGVRQKVVKTVYNTIADRYIEMELNQLSSNITSVTAQQISAQTSSNVTDNQMAAAINMALDLISGGMGGYIHIEYSDAGLPTVLYISDDLELEASNNILRLTRAGISHSNSGLNGDFDDIITQEGNIVSIDGEKIVSLGEGAMYVLLSGDILSILQALSLNDESVTALQAVTPFALTDSSNNIGYRYGGDAGAGDYNAPHYFNGDVYINGRIHYTDTF